MASSIMHFLELKQYGGPVSVWSASGGAEDYDPILNPAGMSPPSAPVYRKGRCGIRKDGDRIAVDVSYSADFTAVMLFGEDPGLTGEDVQLLSDLLYRVYSEHDTEAGRKRLDRIIGSIGETTSSLDLEEVFSNILANTLEVIGNADYGTLWLFDEKSGKLVCRASEGYRFEEIRQMAFSPGEGPIGHAFQDGQPVLITDPSDADYRKASKISRENKQRWGRMVEDITNVRSVIAYPITVDGKVECVMYLAQMQSDRILTKRDLWLLRVFTAQVGIAIRNAKQFADIRQLNEKLIRRDAIHQSLTDLAVRNMGTEKIVEELSRMAGQPLLFADLIVNETIPPGKRLPDSLAYGNLLERIGREETKKVSIGTESGATLYPVRSGSVVLGCLIARKNGQLGRLEEMAIEQGTSILALELVQKQNVLAFYYKNQRDLFDSLIRSENPDVLQENADALGIGDTRNLTAAILQVSGCPDPQEMEAVVFRLIAQLKKTAADRLQTIFGWQNRVILLASLKEPSDRSLFARRMERLLKDSGGTGPISLRGGIGSSVNGLHEIERTYREAEIALDNPIAEQSGVRLVRYEEIGLRRLFTSRNTEESRKFLADIFGPLREADRSGNTLEQTLVVYFDCNRASGQAAEALHIHINTLYQRLRKIEDTLGVSFKNSDDVLQLQLACYLLRHTAGYAR